MVAWFVLYLLRVAGFWAGLVMVWEWHGHERGLGAALAFLSVTLPEFADHVRRID